MKGHIRARGRNTWAIKYDIGRDPKTGKRRSKWVTVHGSKRDAQRELRRLLHELDTGTQVEPSRLTVGEFLERWLADYAQHNVSAKTNERYGEIVRKHLVPALGAHQLTKLTPLHVQQYYSEALKRGRLDGKGPLSAQTVKHFHRLLSQALKHAVRWQLLARNVCEAVDPPSPIRRKVPALPATELATLLRRFDGTRLDMPVFLAATTGLRRGEILGLHWPEVDLDGGTLAVVQSLEQTKAGLRLKPPKNDRSRCVALPGITVEALRNHRVSQMQERMKLGLGRNDDGLVFTRLDGEPVNPRNFSKEFTRIAATAGVTRISFHGLRHSHISHLLREGIHPKVASERAGHASVAITMDIYSHVMPGMQEDAAARIDAAIRRALEE